VSDLALGEEEDARKQIENFFNRQIIDSLKSPLERLETSFSNYVS